MMLEELAELCSATPEQIAVAHKVAETRVERELPIPVTRQDAQLIGLTVCVLQVAVAQYPIADIAAVCNLSSEEQAVLATFPPVTHAELAPTEVVGEVVRVAPTEVAIAA